MGAANSTGLVDSVLDGDIQQLKTLLHDHEGEAKRAKDAPAAANDSLWREELEEAVHTVVASEIESGQQLQQLQIALELLLQARPEAWSSTAFGQDTSENNEESEATTNAAGWSACHRACATGNLAFVAFALLHHPAQFELQARDSFGLFPVDLVPPELLMSVEEIADNLRAEPDMMKPGTARSRRCLALQRLRERKLKLQDQQVRTLLAEARSEDASASSNQEEEQTAQDGGFYVAFEPRREHLSIDQACNMGHVHERGALLRVNYRLPRAEPFLNGYFQLIWRELGDARSEEPNYDAQVTRLRDENARSLDQEAPLQLQQPEEAQGSQATSPDESAPLIPRSIDGPEASPVVEGSFPVDVAQLPADSVCHVLFIACDRHMLHRTIVLSTEGLAVQTADIGDPDSDDYFSDSTSDGVEDEEEAVEQTQEAEAKQPGYTFFVGGEEFSHPNSVFAGQSFPDVESFESFLRDLRVKKQRKLQEKQERQQRDPEQGTNQQQEAGQEAGEMASKSDTSGRQQQEEVRPAEKPADTDEHSHDNQGDSETES
jgi:hypothetical protein